MTAFELPLKPFVLFMYNPFEMPVMRRVLARLTSSLIAAPRQAIVIYANPMHGRVFDRSPAFELVAEGALDPTEEERPYGYGGRGNWDRFKIWRTREPAPDVAQP